MRAVTPRRAEKSTVRGPAGSRRSDSQVQRFIDRTLERSVREWRRCRWQVLWRVCRDGRRERVVSSGIRRALGLVGHPARRAIPGDRSNGRWQPPNAIARCQSPQPRRSGFGPCKRDTPKIARTVCVRGSEQRAIPMVNARNMRSDLVNQPIAVETCRQRTGSRCRCCRESAADARLARCAPSRHDPPTNLQRQRLPFATDRFQCSID